MLRRVQLVLATVALAGLTLLVTAPMWQSRQSADVAASATRSRQAFHDTMRKLWEDHITWTRCYLISKGTLRKDLPDLAPTIDRLLQNQTDLGNAFATFYGRQAGDDLTALLRVHILTANDIVVAAKAGDTTAENEAIEAWYANAHDIAVFLHALNPSNWSLADLDAMMKAHLDLTLEEAVARLQGRYADDIAAYEKVHLEILEMADVLSAGIIAQFPSAFSA
jgi:hypothetical protein